MDFVSIVVYFALVSDHHLYFSLAKKMIWVLGALRACLPNWHSTWMHALVVQVVPDNAFAEALAEVLLIPGGKGRIRALMMNI